MKIELNLSAEEATRLKIKAAQGGLSVSELLTGFASDLICGAKTRGSDERMYANAWYDRCGFTFGETSLLSAMAEDHAVDYYLGLWEGVKSAREALAEEEDADIRADMETYEEELRYVYEQYGCKGNMEQELEEAARKWNGEE